MIENTDSRGNFLTVENGKICLKSKDSKSAQVWKITAIEENWVDFQGVPPDGTEGKPIAADMGNYTLFYGDGAMEDFRLENATDDTFRVAFKHCGMGMYWQIITGRLVITNILTYAAKWKLTKCSQ
ncbi:hypothetical protein BDR07DRAFT_1439422 [Suillus spraguei]|nr:hypothetical protein BDR07DRAFT_1439422 [Suillus spraguei]